MTKAPITSADLDRLEEIGRRLPDCVIEQHSGEVIRGLPVLAETVVAIGCEVVALRKEFEEFRKKREMMDART